MEKTTEAVEEATAAAADLVAAWAKGAPSWKVGQDWWRRGLSGKSRFFGVQGESFTQVQPKPRDATTY